MAEDTQTKWFQIVLLLISFILGGGISGIWGHSQRKDLRTEILAAIATLRTESAEKYTKMEIKEEKAYEVTMGISTQVIILETKIDMILNNN